MHAARFLFTPFRLEIFLQLDAGESRVRASPFMNAFKILCAWRGAAPPWISGTITAAAISGLFETGDIWVHCSFCAYSIIPGLQETLLSIDTGGGGGLFRDFQPNVPSLFFKLVHRKKKKPTLLVCRPVGGVVDFSDSSPLINDKVAQTEIRYQGKKNPPSSKTVIPFLKLVVKPKT